MRTTYRNQEKASSGSEGVYESFADMVLCTVIVLITLVVVLALNVVKSLPLYIEPNHFSGGATRPWLYIQAQKTDYSQTTSQKLELERAVYNDAPFVMVNLFSPSSAQSATKVEDGQTVSAREGQSFHGQVDLSAYNFLQLAAGIEPGSFPVNGDDTALMLPKFSHKKILVEGVESGYATEPDRTLALETMALAWPIYHHELYPRRAAFDYRNARTKIYLEVLENRDESVHQIMIGHTVFTLPEDSDNGRLGWLQGFSSGLTEVVYLGKAWSDSSKRTNKRIEFFEQNGFPEAAEAYREFSFPGPTTALQEKYMVKAMKARPDLQGEELEPFVRAAEAQIAVSEAIASGLTVPKEYMPPLLVHRDAWKAYTDSCIKKFSDKEKPEQPPQWLLDEFLEPLGFSQAVVRGFREEEF